MPRPFLAIVPAVIGLLLCGGCLRGPLGSPRAEAALVRDGGWTLVPAVAVPRADGPAGCGAQALAAVLAFGAAEDVDRAAAISDELPWHDTGATPVDLLLAARARGWSAEIRPGTAALLSAEVAAGHPPLVMLDVGLEVRTLFARFDLPRVMHWAVVTGVAEDGRAVLLGATRSRHHVVDAAWFDRRWAAADRCTLVLRPPAAHATPPVADQLPES
jgi:hypothetical protein